MADVGIALISRRAGFAPDWSAIRLALQATGFKGNAMAMRPGTWFPPGVVVAWFADNQSTGHASDFPTDLPWDFEMVHFPGAGAGAGTQVYRQLDEQGRFARDVMRRLEDDPVVGMVLLEEIWRENRWCATEHPPGGQAQRQAWITQQRPAIPGDADSYRVVDERKK